MSISQRIDRLDRLIHQLRVEYERFFNGALELPPEQLRTEIQAELRSLRSANLKGVEDNFRLGNLEAKLNTYSEHYGRRIRNQEEGRGPATVRRETGPRHDPEHGVVMGGAVDQDAVAALYQGLHRTTGARPQFDMDTFRSYLDRQIDSIRQKTGCERVVFRVSEEQGKLKLKARPVRETDLD